VWVNCSLEQLWVKRQSVAFCQSVTAVDSISAIRPSIIDQPLEAPVAREFAGSVAVSADLARLLTLRPLPPLESIDLGRDRVGQLNALG
jgi:hypothetical protein